MNEFEKEIAMSAEAVTRGDYNAALDMIADDAVFWTANYPAISGKAAMKAACE